MDATTVNALNALDDIKKIIQEHQMFKQALQTIAGPLPTKINPQEIAESALKGWAFPKPCRICGELDCKKD